MFNLTRCPFWAQRLLINKPMDAKEQKAEIIESAADRALEQFEKLKREKSFWTPVALLLVLWNGVALAVHSWPKTFTVIALSFIVLAVMAAESWVYIAALSMTIVMSVVFDMVKNNRM